MTSATTRVVVVLACLAAVGAVVGTTLSAFSAVTNNSGNSFEAASSFGGDLRMASGAYTGNGSDDRQFSIGFQPDVVIVKGNVSQVGVMRTSTMSGDAAKPLSGATGLTTNMIQSFDASGFTLGTDASVNTNGSDYYWVAFKADPSVLKVGSYTGNGSASQSITNAGFSPEHAAVLPASAQRATHRFSGMTRGFQFDADVGTASRVTSLDADGFSVGNSAEVNSASTTYHYVAFNEVAGSVKKGSYAGAGDPKSVTGVGFSPLYAMVRANDTSTGRRGNHRSAAVPGSGSLFYDAVSNTTSGVTSLLADGFQVGTDTSVNADGRTYHYLAFRNAAGGCSTHSTQTLAASADSRVQEANPSTNYGSSFYNQVASSGRSAKKRSHVKFDLPSIPAGCSVTSAKLRLYDEQAASGRTIEVLQNAASWTENGVTWSNQPATTGTAATAPSPSSAAWMEWTVTSQVENMYAGANYGFKVRDAAETSGAAEQGFRSREYEGSNRPELVLTFG